jgi:hypothetical protein
MLLKHKMGLRKFSQETRDPPCKIAINRISKTIRCKTRKRVLEKWKTKLANA